MQAAPLPANEADRLRALYSYEVLDTACEATFDNIAHLAGKLLGCPMALITLVDSERQWFKSRLGFDTTETPREHAFCAHAILNPTDMLVVPDAQLDPRFADNPLVAGAPDIRFYAGMPLVNAEGMALGTLCTLDSKPRQLSEDDAQTLRRLAEMVMTTLELRRAMHRVRDLASIDHLTGTPNRRALMDAIERAIARQRRHAELFALIYLDLDGFKSINDRQGHAEGDKVLREVAACLTATARREDFVGRLGGDEFAMLVTGSQAQAITAAERVRGQVEARARMHGWALTASIGVASFPAAPDCAESALAVADTLMYAAKAAGKNRVQYGSFAGADPVLAEPG